MRPVDITKKRCGALVAVYPIGSNGRVQWMCLCDCGNEVVLTTSQFNSGKTRSCGCRIYLAQKHIGKKFNKWTVRHVERGFRGRNPANIMVVECECGSTRKGTLTDIKRSLGCFSCRPKPKGQETKNGKNAVLNRHYERYVLNAHNRGIEFQLSPDEFERIVLMDCAYCGKPPKEKKYKQSVLPLNGVDRINNSEGYLLKNCAPCCSQCNRAKFTYDASEFLEWVSRVHEYTNA